MKSIKKLIVFSIIAGFAACGSDGGGNTPSQGETGSFELNIVEDMSKMFIPDIDMETDHYQILITGPRPAGPDNTRERIVPNSDPHNPPAAQLFENLYYGRWTVTVNAKNADGTTKCQNSTIIGTGTNTVVVDPWADGLHGSPIPQVTVTVIPIPGKGNLNITVSWDGDVTVEPVLTATLIPHIGPAAALNVVMNSEENGGTITNVNPLANGYYTLTVELRERDGLLVVGGSDIVRIVTGQKTTGAINWGSFINPHFGDFIVNIDPQMREPIFLTISGNLEGILPGNSMTVDVAVDTAATVPDVVGNVVYFWYENGEYLGTGDTITTPAHTLEEEIEGLDQFYRVDVVCYTTDGMRAGDSTFTYQVSEKISPNSAITSFNIPGAISTAIVTDEVGDIYTITVNMPYGTSVTDLTPAITIIGSSVSPASGTPQDFTSPVEYTVTAEDGSTKVYTVTVTIAAPASYTVTFDSQGATLEAIPASKTVTFPATTVDALPTAPTRTGYTFGGWYTGTNGAGTKFTAVTAVTADITVYAKWTTSGASYNDNFDDGNINTNLWMTGGRKFDAFGGCNWVFENKEIIDSPDGYFSAHVYGPTSGLTYGAEAWIRTKYNFNDGQSYIINFAWEPTFADSDLHCNLFYIQITDGYLSSPDEPSYRWPQSNYPGTYDLLRDTNTTDKGWVFEGETSPGKLLWSITVDSSGIAKLFNGENASGDLLRQESLDSSCPWYIRFIVDDATSAGYPAGDAELKLYNFSAALAPQYALRDVGPAGGYIFYDKGYYSDGWRYLEAAPIDQSDFAEWGCYGKHIKGADGTEVGTGYQNTIDIEAGCITAGTAADICENLTLGGYSDWFLPSRDELNLMYINLKVAGVGSLVGQFYWSSSEYDDKRAWCQLFINGYQDFSSAKGSNGARVRAIRAF